MANIIKDLSLNEKTGQPKLNEAIEKLQQPNINDDELITALQVLEQECNKSVPHRVLAVKLNALEILLSLVEANMDKESVIHHCVLAANSITHKNPDVFDRRALEMVKKLLGFQKNDKLVCDVLRWIQKSCSMHETNRQMIMNDNLLLSNLKPMLETGNSGVVREVSACLRLLILDGKFIGS